MPGGIVIADDGVMIGDILRTLLCHFGQRVFVAANGLEAVAYARRVQACLVVLDMKMPVLNGLLTCRRIRAVPGHARTPIFMLTAHDVEGARNAASRVGVTSFVTKPFQPAVLQQRPAPLLPITPEAMAKIWRSAARVQELGSDAQERGHVIGTGGAPPADNCLDRGRQVLGVDSP